MKNSWRVFLLLFAASVTFWVISYRLWERFGLLWSTFLIAGLTFLLYTFGEFRLLKLLQAQKVEGRDPWGLKEMTEDLARRAHVPVPQLFVIPVQTPTALTIGRDLENTGVLLSQSLVESFQPDELRAVLAHEIARIQRSNPLPLVMVAALAGGLFVLHPFRNVHNSKPFSAGSLLREIGSWLATPWIHLVLFLCVSSREFYKVDQLASENLGDPQVLARTLWKLQALANTKPLRVSRALSHLFIVNPLTGQSRLRYFFNQPSVESRIRRLIGDYPV